MRRPVKPQTWANAKRRPNAIRALHIYAADDARQTRTQPSLAPMPWLSRPIVPLGHGEIESDESDEQAGLRS